MLWFVGLGTSPPSSIPIAVVRLAPNADILYLEQFTSPFGDMNIQDIESLGYKCVKIAKRWQVEDGTEILKNAKDQTVVLATYGDPYIATTHIELRSRAIKDGIMTMTIHGASALTSLIGECGLHYYKVGRTATIMSEKNATTTPYYTTQKNMLESNHTILLLEYNQDQDFFLDPKQALEMLLEEEREQVRNVFNSDTCIIVASRVGQMEQKITVGNLSHMLDVDFGKPPHTVIIPGSMHFTESDALKLLADCLDKPKDNSSRVEKISHQMLAKYIPMVNDALDDITPHYSNTEFKTVLENAKLYVKDAKNFLDMGRDEVAILSIGYADGLVDALRMGKGMEPRM